ncbi:MAG TPA: DUF4142 domain-containing protein [Thermoanaerobaculia bacterium]|jgi:putative membrane protein
MRFVLASALLFATACSSMTGGAATGRMPEGDIAAIVSAANEGEIEQGNVAASRATSGEVRAFGQMMVADHTQALNMGRDVFTRNGITPSENATSEQLRASSRTSVSNLNRYSGRDFDRRYMQSQVDLHQWLLTNLDQLLIPSARNAEVRQLLTTQRASVATHLEQARAILGRL